MAFVLTSLSGNLISAASAGFAPTNSADVSAIASAYQVVSATATQLNAGTAYLTSVNSTPISAARAGNASNASLATSAWYDGTGRMISSLPDEATVSSIASSYAESAASSKLDESATADFYSTSNPSGFITGVDLSNYATTAYVDSSISSFVDSAYVDSQVSGKEDKLTFGYDDAAISSINGSALAGGGGVDSATVSAIASAYVESGVSGKQDTITYGYNSGKISSIDGSGIYIPKQTQVVTSLQYATSESATVASTVTADTAVGYGARDISADYYDYGYGPWTDYDSSTPLIKVRMTAAGNMANYSSNPYYLYVVPYGATNNGNVSNTGDLTGALAYGEFSGGMNDFIIAEGTGSASDPYYVEVTFDVTHVPFVGSEPAFWGTVEEHYAVVDIDEGTKPVFCVAGGNYGAELFELRGNTTAELDFGSVVTVSAVSGINELDIYTTGGGGADTSAVSAIASAYANSAVSGVSSTVYGNSARWDNAVPYSAFTGSNGLVTGVVSGLGWASSVSGLMGVGSAFKESTGVLDTAQDTVSATADVGYDATVTVSGFVNDPTRLYYYDINGSLQNAILYMYSTSKLEHVSGIITASSVYSPGYDFGCTYTSMSPEALAFQSDLTGAGVDSATVSAIASSYAESAVSGKLDTTAFNSGDFYSTSNPSGFIDSAYVDSAVSGKADSSALSSYVPYSGLEYNTASAISGINGSALAAGSTYSAGEGIDITDDVISVETPVDIVAGPGIVIDNPDGNTLRVSQAANYEVTLFENASGTTTNIVCSEKMSNFDRVRFYLFASENTITGEYTTEFAGSSTVFRLARLHYNNGGTYPFVIYGTYYSTTDSKTITIGATEHIWFGPSWNVGGTSTTSPIKFVKIVGVNRIAND